MRSNQFSLQILGTKKKQPAYYKSFRAPGIEPGLSGLEAHALPARAINALPTSQSQQSSLLSFAVLLLLFALSIICSLKTVYKMQRASFGSDNMNFNNINQLTGLGPST